MPSRLVLILAMLAATPVLADESTPSPLPKPAKISVQGYGAADPGCAEWTDGCHVCTSGDKTACSTAGVACTPKAIACTKRK